MSGRKLKPAAREEFAATWAEAGAEAGGSEAAAAAGEQRSRQAGWSGLGEQPFARTRIALMVCGPGYGHVSSNQHRGRS